jgi:hypothetical protein
MIAALQLGCECYMVGFATRQGVLMAEEARRFQGIIAHLTVKRRKGEK